MSLIKMRISAFIEKMWEGIPVNKVSNFRIS